jgi:hypothetical protein
MPSDLGLFARQDHPVAQAHRSECGVRVAGGRPVDRRAGRVRRASGGGEPVRLRVDDAGGQSAGPRTLWPCGALESPHTSPSAPFAYPKLAGRQTMSFPFIEPLHPAWE